MEASLSDRPGKKERIELSPERAELIASTHERLEKMDLFTLMDVDLNANASVLRRGYFKQSLIFHPDRYFSKDLGPYKKMLERIFAFISASYEFLKDDRKRAAYRKKLLTARDAAVGPGGGVAAVQTARGLVFKIVDETSFFAADEAAVAAGGEKVTLPQKRYALPRVRAAGRPAQPSPEPEPEPPAEPASEEEGELEFDIDVSFDD